MDHILQKKIDRIIRASVIKYYIPNTIISIQDCINEGWIKVLENFYRIKDIDNSEDELSENSKSYIYTITKNKVIDLNRKYVFTYNKYHISLLPKNDFSNSADDKYVVEYKLQHRSNINNELDYNNIVKNLFLHLKENRPKLLEHIIRVYSGSSSLYFNAEKKSLKKYIYKKYGNIF